MERRTFLRSLAALPLIGGSVALLGNPTAAAVPVTVELLNLYDAWLCHELGAINNELRQRREGRPVCDLYRDHPEWTASILSDVPFNGVNRRGIAGAILSGPPSNRAAVVLAAAGVPLGRSA